MVWVTWSCWPSTSYLRNGKPGWRGVSYRLLSGLIITTFHISSQLSSLTQDRCGGSCSLADFMISRCPVPKNVKSDTLSKQFNDVVLVGESETIIPSSCVVGMLSWQLEAVVTAAKRRESDPGGGHDFVSSSTRFQVQLTHPPPWDPMQHLSSADSSGARRRIKIFRSLWL